MRLLWRQRDYEVKPEECSEYSLVYRSVIHFRDLGSASSGAVPGYSDPDIQQLKDKLQQLEQIMEVKGQITALEIERGGKSSEAGHPPVTQHDGALPPAAAPDDKTEQKKPESDTTIDIYGFVMMDTYGKTFSFSGQNGHSAAFSKDIGQ